jgi:ABC-type transporter Mla subunit MlaD
VTSAAGDRDETEGGTRRSDPVSEAAKAFAAMTQQFSAAAASGATGAVMQPVAQLEAMAKDIAARREQVQALVAQLNAFDEQLAAFERTLLPMLEWTRSWARLAAAADPLGLTRRPPTP